MQAVNLMQFKFTSPQGYGLATSALNVVQEKKLLFVGLRTEKPGCNN